MIRFAERNDMPGILPLLIELGYPCILEDLQARFRKFVNNAGYGVAVCTANSAIVGLIAWSKSELFISEQVRIHIEALIVKENHRSMGIGKKLMAFVDNIAKQYSPVIVDLTSSLWREEATYAHSFYKNLGFDNKKPSVYFRKEL